jgi:hypothetical protein
MNQNKLKSLYTAAIILGLCAFTPPRKCASPCKESAAQKECATSAFVADDTATEATATGATHLLSAPPSTPGQKKAIAPNDSKRLNPGKQAVTKEREEIPADSPFLVALYV